MDSIGRAWDRWESILSKMFRPSKSDVSQWFTCHNLIRIEDGDHGIHTRDISRRPFAQLFLRKLPPLRVKPPCTARIKLDLESIDYEFHGMKKSNILLL